MIKKLVTAALAVSACTMPALAANAKNITAVMYKNPGCECCDGHAAALRKAGFDVKVVPTEKLATRKAEAGVPKELQGCHTTIVAGYAVEGHVPIAAVQRLLRERPKVRGIALPGMPAGSPGMGGVKAAPFKVLSFSSGGTQLYSVEK